MATKNYTRNTLNILHLILKWFFKKIHVNNFLESIIANGYKYQPQADCLARLFGAVKVNKPITMQIVLLWLFKHAVYIGVLKH